MLELYIRVSGVKFSPPASICHPLPHIATVATIHWKCNICLCRPPLATQSRILYQKEMIKKNYLSFKLIQEFTKYPFKEPSYTCLYLKNQPSEFMNRQSIGLLSCFYNMTIKKKSAVWQKMVGKSWIWKAQHAATSKLISAYQQNKFNIEWPMSNYLMPSPSPAKMQYHIFQIVCPLFPKNVKSV